jgi:lipid-binding SYLF domain-containing protein
MKFDYRRYIAGAAMMVLAGVLPASAQDTVKSEAVKTNAPATPAQRPDAAQPAKPELSAAEQRAEIDKMAAAAHEELFAKSPEAKTLYGTAYGCAVFDNLKLAFLLTAGGGKGVAIPKAHPEMRTYMSMGSAGVGIGLGAHKYQVVFLFETKERFEKFVNEGWVADVAANAVAGKEGASAQAGFVNGIAIYQLTEGGLMLQADISGTKYSRDDELNMKHEQTD